VNDCKGHTVEKQHHRGGSKGPKKEKKGGRDYYRRVNGWVGDEISSKKEKVTLGYARSTPNGERAEISRSLQGEQWLKYFRRPRTSLMLPSQRVHHWVLGKENLRIREENRNLVVHLLRGKPKRHSR